MNRFSLFCTTSLRYPLIEHSRYFFFLLLLLLLFLLMLDVVTLFCDILCWLRVLLKLYFCVWSVSAVCFGLSVGGFYFACFVCFMYMIKSRKFKPLIVGQTAIKEKKMMRIDWDEVKSQIRISSLLNTFFLFFVSSII